jgi:hypothetical protein
MLSSTSPGVLAALPRAIAAQGEIKPIRRDPSPDRRRPRLSRFPLKTSSVCRSILRCGRDDGGHRTFAGERP